MSTPPRSVYTPKAAPSKMARGNKVNFDLDDASAYLVGVPGAAAKAKINGESVFVPCYPFPLRNESGEMQDFYSQTVIAEIGSGQKFCSFVAIPSDQPDIHRDDIPVSKLRSKISKMIDANDPALTARAATALAPKGKYEKPDLPWPQTYLLMQVFAYRVPGFCEDSINTDPTHLAKTVIVDSGLIEVDKNNTPTPKMLRVYSKPEYKVLFVKGTGRDALAELFEATGPDGQYLIPNNFGMGGFPTGIQTFTEKDDQDRAKMSMAPFDIAKAGLVIPTPEEVAAAFKPWDKIVKKIRYQDQIQKLIDVFGADVVALAFPDVTNVSVQTGAGTSGWQAPAGARAAVTGSSPQTPPQAPQPPVTPPAAPPAPPAPPAPAAPVVERMFWVHNNGQTVQMKESELTPMVQAGGVGLPVMLVGAADQTWKKPADFGIAAMPAPAPAPRPSFVAPPVAPAPAPAPSLPTAPPATSAPTVATSTVPSTPGVQLSPAEMAERFKQRRTEPAASPAAQPAQPAAPAAAQPAAPAPAKNPDEPPF